MRPRPLRVLLTGGAGYVGSHVLVELLTAGHDVTVFDNLATAGETALSHVRAIAGCGFGFVRGDLRDAAAVTTAVAATRPDATIHCAGLKSPIELLSRPETYRLVNVEGTRTLVAALTEQGCRRLVFSSSAAIYGPPEHLPIREDHPLNPATPYGATKRDAERVLVDAAAQDPGWAVALLRYFNPAGAHDSASLGEIPAGRPVNLMPNLIAVAAGLQPALTVHGVDWDTPDGTGVRDYIHIVDLARAHLAALDWTGRAGGAEAFNVGTGRGVSVRELAAAVATSSGRQTPIVTASRRAGDVASAWADPSKAARLLGWRAERGIGAICSSAWAWHLRNAGEQGECRACEKTSPTALDPGR